MARAGCTVAISVSSTRTDSSHITGRKKDLIITAAGKNIAPQDIELELRYHPLISQAVVVGEARRYLTALITLDPDEMAGWADHHGKIADTEALAQDPDVLAAVQSAIADVNAARSRAESIRRFRVLPNDFTVAGNELTPTLKVKRNVVNDKYRGPNRGYVCRIRGVMTMTLVDLPDRAGDPTGVPDPRRAAAPPPQSLGCVSDGGGRPRRCLVLPVEHGRSSGVGEVPDRSRRVAELHGHVPSIRGPGHRSHRWTNPSNRHSQSSGIWWPTRTRAALLASSSMRRSPRAPERCSKRHNTTCT